MKSRILAALLILSNLFYLQVPTIYAASSPWEQTNWAGGSGQTAWSDATRFDSSSNVTTSTAGQITLTNTEKFTNTGFESNLTGWNTGIQPSSISGLQVWYKADALSSLNDGDAVTTWNDSSGNSRDASQSTADKKPSYQTNELNSQPVVRFDGGDYLDQGSAIGLNNNNPMTMMVVTKLSSLTSRSPMFTVGQSGSAGTYAGIEANTFSTSGQKFGAYLYGTSYDSSQATDTSSFHIIAPVVRDATIGGSITANTDYYFDGATKTLTSTAGTGTFNSLASANAATIGGFSGVTSVLMGGDIAEVIAYNSALSTTNRSRIENYLRDKYNITVAAGITSVTRDTGTTYNSSAGSAKLVTSSSDTGEFTQTVNVGDTNSYNLSAYAYKDGSAVTSSDVELFYNGSTISTTYTSVGGGWYQLTGTLTGANASRLYGVQVKANKTIYVDNMSLNNYPSSGTLTSSIFDTEQSSNWGTLTYSATTPSNTSVTVKARTSNDSGMSGATAFASCNAITSGSDISSNNCVTDTHRYIQYQVTLANTDTSVTPTFSDISVAFTASDATAPTISLTPLSPDPNTDSTPTLSGTATEAVGTVSNVQFQMDSTAGSWSACSASDGTFDEAEESFNCTSSALSDGSHTMYVRATDSNGNTTSSGFTSDTFTIDTTAPAISLTPLSPDPNNDTTPLFSGTVTEETGTVSNVQFQIDSTSGSWTSCSASDGSFDEASESFTCQVTAELSDGSHTIYVRATDSNNNTSATPASDNFTIDQTAPDGVSLNSPGDNTFTSNSRPTFRWKSATGITKYRLYISNGTGGDIVIDNISPTGTGEDASSKYVIKYENFSDSDSDNNYILVYTKSSPEWSSSDNNGELREGKRTWQVTAYDSAGNTTSSSRTLYADYTGPTLNSVAIKNLGEIEDYLLVTDFTISGTITDNLAPDSIEVSFYKENYLLGIHTFTGLSSVFTYSLKNTNNTLSLGFSFVPTVDQGKFIIKIAGVDKATHKSSIIEFKIQYLSEAKAKELLAKLGDKEKLEQLKEESKISIPGLEKQALQHRQIEASQLQELLSHLRDFLNGLGIVGQWIANLWDNTGQKVQLAFEVWRGVGKQIGYQSEMLSSSIASGAEASGQLVISMTNSITSSIAYFAQQAPPALAGQIQTATYFNKQIDNQLSQLELETKKRLAQNNNQIKEDFISTIRPVVTTVNENIVAIQFGFNQIGVEAKQLISQFPEQASQTLDSAYQLVERPINKTEGFLNQVNVGLNSFYAIVFDNNPTVIADVTVEEIGKDYAIISWKTNHYATGKINYGVDLTYGEEIILDQYQKEHRVRLTNLKPGHRYYFEVMNAGKNYVYDAYYSFETKEQGSSK